MAKLLLVGAALLLCLSTVSAGEGCKDTITGFSGTFGKRIAGRLDRFTNQTGQWRSKGAITKVEGFYSTNYGCIQGLKVTYGPNPQDARLLGQEVAGLTTRELALNEGELINKVQIKADNCVEYLRLHTSQGRLFELGNAGSPTTLITSYPNRPTGFLAAVRGFEEYNKNGGSVSRASLRTLQFVWANCNAFAAQRSGTFGGSGSGGLSARHTSGLELESAPLDAAAAAEAGAMIPSGTKLPPAEPADPAAAAVEALACPAQVDMCASDASSTSTAFCPVVAPFKKAACMGGCCVSSGKCTSSSCAISGIGKEVPNTICYGLNPAIAIGASASCRGLACKLSVPGCTSDLLGGSCVGTVVDLAGNAATRNPAGAKLIGYPCLDVTPSDKTLNKDGALVKDGPYVAKLWSICDCHAPTVVTRQGFLGFPAIGKLNITDLKGLVAAFRPDNGSSPLHGVLEAVKAKLPPMVIPEGENALNLTTALTVIGNLVGKAAGSPDGEANQLGAVADLIKGAAAVAAAGNSTNPLGSLLGALAPKMGNQTNPLAGLGNLVAALSPKGAGVTEKSDVLSTVLGALNSGTGAAPQADLLGAVSKLVAGANDSGVDLSTLVSKFKPGNATDVMKSLLGAVSQGRDAANGQVDLAGILNKAKDYVAGNAGAHPGLEKIISGVQSLAENGSAEKGLGLLKNLAQDAAGRNGSATLQNIVDMASKAGPLLQQLQGGAAAVNEAGPAGVGPGGENAWAGMLKNMASEKGPLAGVDVNAVTGLAQKVAPLLQALGSGQGGPTGKEIMAAAEGVGQGINLDGNNWKTLQEAAQKLTPVLETLSKSAGAANNPNLAGLQGLIDRMRQPAETVAAAVPAAVPDLSGPAPGVIKAMSLPVDVAAPVAAAAVPAAAAAAAVPAAAAAAVPAAAAAAVPAAAAAVPAAAAAVPAAAAAAAAPVAAAAVPAAAAAAVPAAAAAAVPAAAAAAVPAAAAAVPAAASAAAPAAAGAAAAAAAAKP